MDPLALRGRWRLERVIDDRRLGELSRVDGWLVLTQVADDEVAWEEQATWYRAEGDVAVRRGLRVVRVGDGWWVRFEDGRDFHPWTVGETVVHDCAPDTYRGRVSGTSQEWTVEWDVEGPGKDYTMTTVLRPG